MAGLLMALIWAGLALGASLALVTIGARRFSRRPGALLRVRSLVDTGQMLPAVKHAAKALYTGSFPCGSERVLNATRLVRRNREILDAIRDAAQSIGGQFPGLLDKAADALDREETVLRKLGATQSGGVGEQIRYEWWDAALALARVSRSLVAEVERQQRLPG